MMIEAVMAEVVVMVTAGDSSFDDYFRDGIC